MRGTAYFASYDALHLIPAHCDVKLQIVHSVQKGLRPGFIQVPQLAPSDKLFESALYRWKKLRFTKAERAQMANGPTGTWYDLYEPAFKQELTTRSDAKKAYARVKEHLEAGRSVALICYCEDETRCHRSIIARQLASEGYFVVLH